MASTDSDMSESLAKISTPNLVPWIPPGKPKESTFNAFAHKKNQGVYEMGSSIAAEPGFWPVPQKKSIIYKDFDPKKPKRSIQSLGGLQKRSVSITRQKRIDDLLNASHNSLAERDYLRKRILEIFQESDEGKEIVKELVDKKGQHRRNSDPGRKESDKSRKDAKKQRPSSYDGDERSEPYTPDEERSRERKNGKKRANDEGYNSDSDRNATRGRKTKNSRGKNGSANTMTSGVGSADDDIEERNSVEFIDFDSQPDSKLSNYQNPNGNFNGPSQPFPLQGIPNIHLPNSQFPGQVFPGQHYVGQSYQYQGVNYPGQFQGNLLGAQSLPPQMAGPPGFQGPGYNGYNGYGNQQTMFDDPRTSNFGGNFDSRENYFLSPSPAGFQSLQLSKSRLSQSGSKEAWLILPKEGESPRRSVPNVREYTAKRLNLASSIGGKLKQSFAQINRSSTPVESTSRSMDPLVDEGSDDGKSNQQSRRQKALIAGGAACCFLFTLASVLILAIIFGTTSGSSNVSLENQGFYLSPGSENDTRPCQVYEPLSESWRRIVGYGPSNTGTGYHCDLPQFSQGSRGIREGWYRFMGEAGTHMATSSPGAYSPQAGTLKEVCGTSYVGWMNGQHPTIREGIVKRNFCFEWESGTCQYGFESYVRTCPDTNGDPTSTFYVYFLKIPRDIQCNFAFCALP